MFHKKNPQVIVAGAGPVGLVTALCLARRGIRVRIVDEAWRTAQHSYALALHPGALELLDELGLFEEIVDQSLLVKTVGFYDGPRRVTGVELSRLPGNFGFVAVSRQSVLEGVLAGALEKEGVKVEWNHRVSRMEQRPHGINVTVDRLVKESMGYAVAHTEWLVGSSHDHEVPFLVAADGHGSIMRKQQGIGFPDVGPPFHLAVYEFDVEEPLPPEMCVVMDAGTTNVLWPLPDNRGRFSFQIREQELSLHNRDKERLAADLGELRFPALDRESLLRFIAERAPWFDAKVGDIEWRMAVRFDRRLADKFGEDRLWLAGDAGHVTWPVGAQSMNVGMREGRNLAEVLSEFLYTGGALDRRPHYDRTCREEWRTLLEVDHVLASGPETDPWIRDRAGRLLSCLPGSGWPLEAMLRQLGLELTPRQPVALQPDRDSPDLRA